LLLTEDWSEPNCNYPVSDLHGLTLGLIGYGRIGKKVGEFARAFGMDLKVYDPFIGVPEKLKASLDEIFATTDYISLHIPLTADNEKLISTVALSKMKPGVIIVNCSRGH
jgi:phosphoglycerate dehydrogenase-like enzyme